MEKRFHSLPYRVSGSLAHKAVDVLSYLSTPIITVAVYVEYFSFCFLLISEMRIEKTDNRYLRRRDRKARFRAKSAGFGKREITKTVLKKTPGSRGRFGMKSDRNNLNIL